MNELLIDKYNDISNPNDLYKFIVNNIEYGYLGKNGKIYNVNDENFYKDWLENYILQFSEDILKTRIGTCWDQVEFERYWFKEYGYEIKTIYEMVYVDYENDYPTHSCLFYKDLITNDWYWFECADYANRGIYKFNNFENALMFQLNKYKECLKNYNINFNEINNIVVYEYGLPKRYIGVNEYIDFCLNSNKLNI